MKKVFALTAAALISATTLFAQETTSNEGVRFGIKLAPNLSWLRSDTKGLESDGSKLGFTFGLVLEFPVGENGNYRFATGAFLQNVGGKYNQTFTYTSNNQLLTKPLTSDIKLQYVEVPLTMKLMTNEIGYMRYYGQIGFGAAFNIRAKADYETVSIDPTTQNLTFPELEDEDIKTNIQPFRASLIVGAGAEYNFSGKTTVQFGVNYNNGFTNILKNTKVGDKDAKVLQDFVELNLAVFF